MATVGVHEAKTQFSKLLKRVAAGEEITVTRGGTPVAKLVPVPGRARILGSARGQFAFPEDWARSDAEIEAMFEEATRSKDP